MGCGVQLAFVGGSGYLFGVVPALGEGDASSSFPTFCKGPVPSSLAGFCSGSALGGRVVCAEGSDGVCNSCTASSLFPSPGSRVKMSKSCSSVNWMPVGEGMVFGTREGRGFAAGFACRAVGGVVLDCIYGVVAALRFAFARYG